MVYKGLDLVRDVHFVLSFMGSQAFRLLPQLRSTLRFPSPSCPRPTRPDRAGRPFDPSCVPAYRPEDRLSNKDRNARVAFALCVADGQDLDADITIGSEVA